jgi:3-deoxy-7-phosphoheptulonate synthase
MPVGFKNGSTGNVKIAVDAIRSAAEEHWFDSVTKQGVAAIFQTSGNPDCHLILRGGTNTGPNFDTESVAEATELLSSSDTNPHLMIDCSHANSGKDHQKQVEVSADVARQVAGGNQNICGVMLESHLKEGAQKYVAGQSEYGLSITDACMSFDNTIPVLRELAEAVQKRRA